MCRYRVAWQTCRIAILDATSWDGCREEAWCFGPLTEGCLQSPFFLDCSSKSTPGSCVPSSAGQCPLLHGEDDLEPASQVVSQLLLLLGSS